nr:MAG: hypothetical protein [Microvirus sp.]
MAYRRTTARRTSRTRTRRVSGYSRKPVRKVGRTMRRATARRRSSGSAGRTIRLVIEQAAPTVAPVVNEDGRFAVPDNTKPKRAKF